MMDEFKNLSHINWTYKHYIVFIVKIRKKAIYGTLQPHLGEVFRALTYKNERWIANRHLIADHGHMMIIIPAKYAVFQAIDYIKDKEQHPSRPGLWRGQMTSSDSTFGHGLLRLNRRRGKHDPSLH